jgi:glycosyltransferase involved in cell wall biosynthesis
MSPRFSVLLPTRNGGAFIADCIHSVLTQDFSNFELVISDNANDDATPSVLSVISDARLRVVRQPVKLPVHENWNAALAVAQGDYFLMLGDDDFLIPGALRQLDVVLSSYDDPDCVLFNGYSYVAPNSIDDNSASYWSPQHHRYDSSFAMGVLPLENRMAIVRDMFRFRQRIPLNMQTTVFSRRSIRQMPPPVFRAPFPDHYLLNALLIAAGKWIYIPERLIIVGVSPKSFGHYFYGQQSRAGLDYLGIETRLPGMLPGNELLNGMYQWLTLLLANYPDVLKKFKIDRSAYLVRQVRFWLIQYRRGFISAGELRLRLRLMSARDWGLIALSVFDREVWRRLGRLVGLRSARPTQALWPGLQRINGVTNIREFSDWLSDHQNEISLADRS